VLVASPPAPPWLILVVALASGCGQGCGQTESPPTARRPWATWPVASVAGADGPHPRSYAIAEETVTDAVTDLMWQRQVPAGPGSAWTDASQVCERLVLAGHDDWRLPSRIELVSLIDGSRTDPAIPLDAFPFVPGSRPLSDWYWTSTPSAASPNKAWYVYFYFGYPDLDDRSSDFPVRCVRGGRVGAAAVHYEIGVETVRDTGTGLVWQRGISAGTLDFQAATDMCAALELRGPGTWRLPSLQELATLVDDTRAHPAIDPKAFPDTPAEPFWSGSLFAGSQTRAWYVHFEEGSALYEGTSTLHRVRCVR
jgi:hypothetical protein